MYFKAYRLASLVIIYLIGGATFKVVNEIRHSSIIGVSASYSNSSCNKEFGAEEIGKCGSSVDFPNTKDCGPKVTVTANGLGTPIYSCQIESEIPAPDFKIRPNFTGPFLHCIITKYNHDYDNCRP